jgi:hypothetical protein
MLWNHQIVDEVLTNLDFVDLATRMKNHLVVNE